MHNRTTNSCIHASWFSFISSSFFFTFKVSLSWTMQELDDGKVLLRLAHLYEVLFPFLLHSIVARSIISELSLYEVNLFFGISNFYLCYVWFYKSTTGKEKIVRKWFSHICFTMKKSNITISSKLMNFKLFNLDIKEEKYVKWVWKNM